MDINTNRYKFVPRNEISAAFLKIILSGTLLLLTLLFDKGSFFETLFYAAALTVCVYRNIVDIVQMIFNRMLAGDLFLFLSIVFVFLSGRLTQAVLLAMCCCFMTAISNIVDVKLTLLYLKRKDSYPVYRVKRNDTERIVRFNRLRKGDIVFVCENDILCFDGKMIDTGDYFCAGDRVDSAGAFQIDRRYDLALYAPVKHFRPWSTMAILFSLMICLAAAGMFLLHNTDIKLALYAAGTTLLLAYPIFTLLKVNLLSVIQTEDTPALQRYFKFGFLLQAVARIVLIMIHFMVTIMPWIIVILLFLTAGIWMVFSWNSVTTVTAAQKDRF